MTLPRTLALALLSTRQMWGTTEASLSNLKTCLKGTGTRPMLKPYNQPNSQTARACSNSNSPQTKLPATTQVGESPWVCNENKQTDQTALNFLFIPTGPEERSEEQFNMSFFFFLGKKHTYKKCSLNMWYLTNSILAPYILHWRLLYLLLQTENVILV